MVDVLNRTYSWLHKHETRGTNAQMLENVWYFKSVNNSGPDQVKAKAM